MITFPKSLQNTFIISWSWITFLQSGPRKCSLPSVLHVSLLLY